MSEPDRPRRPPSKITIEVVDLIAIAGVAGILLGMAIVAGIGGALAAAGLIALGYAWLKARD